MFLAIGIVLELVLCVLSLFLGTMYSEDWGYASAFREKAYVAGPPDSFTLLSMYGWVCALVIGLVILFSVGYLVAFFLKKAYLLPSFLIIAAYLLPIGMIFAGIGTLASDGQFVQIGFITVGHGTHAGMTAFGFVFLLGSILAFVLTCIGIHRQKAAVAAENKQEVKEIRRKEARPEKANAKPTQPIGKDDWKL